MPITKSTHEGTWDLDDIYATGVSREQVASKLKNSDGSPKVVTMYFATGQLVGGRAPVEARVQIPKKVYHKVRRALAPYLIDEVVKAFSGTKKAPGVDDPDPGDQD